MLAATPAVHRWGVSSPGVLSLVESYLADAARRTHARLGDVAGVALTSAVADGEPVTAGASTPLAAEVDAVQLAIGRGPCLATLRGAGELYVPDLARDGRWGRYGGEAAVRGARASLSVPVVDDSAVVLGVAKVYALTVDGIDDDQRRVVRDLALEVAGGFGLASTLLATSLELDDRIEAMDTRRTIDLATGILVGRVGCGPEEAFDLLRRESQQHNTKVHDVAADLVARAAAGRSHGGPTGADHGVPGSAGHAPFRRRGEAPARGR